MIGTTGMNREARTCIGRHSVGDASGDSEAFHEGKLRESVFLRVSTRFRRYRDFLQDSENAGRRYFKIL
jgi:hypothetical protein